MLRLLILLVSMLTTRRPGGTAGTTGPARLPRRDYDQRDHDQRDRDWRDRDWRDRDWRRPEVREQEVGERDEWEDGDPWDGDTWYLPPDRPRYEPAPRPTAPRQVIRGQLVRPGRRRRIPRKLAWGGALVLAALIFRKVIAWAVLAVLSGALHLVGLNVRLPHVSFGWPWPSVTAGTTTDVSVGPWVLQKIEGISRPALGTENFNFTFTHKVSKNIGI